MNINVEEVMKARKVIRQAEEELMILVKDYFEKNRNFTVDMKEFIPSRTEEDNGAFRYRVKIEDFDIVVVFTREEEWNSWKYTIYCEQLGVTCLTPKEEKRLSIQGTLIVTFTKKSLDGQVAGSRNIQMYEYYN